MSTHPNAILAVRLTPDDLPNRTFRAILEANGLTEADISEGSASIKVGGMNFTASVFEEDYDADGYQIQAKMGDIVLHDYVTYGYGETITFEKLRERATALEEWAKATAAAHHCRYEVFLTANYW
jgi:hypothetical protein